MSLSIGCLSVFKSNIITFWCSAILWWDIASAMADGYWTAKGQEIGCLKTEHVLLL